MEPRKLTKAERVMFHAAGYTILMTWVYVVYQIITWVNA